MITLVLHLGGNGFNNKFDLLELLTHFQHGNNLVLTSYIVFIFMILVPFV